MINADLNQEGQLWCVLGGMYLKKRDRTQGAFRGKGTSSADQLQVLGT